MRKLGILAALALATTVAFVLAAGPAASGNGTPGPSTTVVMSGLNNPRGLAFGPGGWLYVAEAGSGGSGACLQIRGGDQCVGATGSVSRWKQGRTPQRVATGLPSYAPQVSPPPDGATGPHDIAFDDGKAWLTIGVDGDRDPREIRAAFGNSFGWLARMRKNGSWSLTTDIAAYEVAVNPAGPPVDSNPYGLLVTDEKKYVAEAGGNALLRIRKSSISTVAIFPSRAQGRRTDSVPTEAIKGPGGSFLVSELTGAPFFVGEANIWRVDRNGTVTPYLTGFTTIIDIEWSCDKKHLYVLQLALGPGRTPALLKVNPRTNERVQIAGPELIQPTSVLADCRRSGDEGDFRFADDDDDDDDDDRGGKQRRDVLYVSNKGVLPAVGEVLRLVR
jgi:hypothetical protein